MHDDEWFPLTELTQRLGGLIWVEEQLADLLAVWASTETSAPAAVFFATASGHHGWHGQVVRGCLPTSPRLLEHDVVVAPTMGWNRAIETLSSLDDAEATTPRLKALVRVIDPWLDRETGVLLDLARPVSDAPMMRWLRFVASDHSNDGEAASLLAASADSQATRVADHRLLASLDLTK